MTRAATDGPASDGPATDGPASNGSLNYADPKSIAFAILHACQHCIVSSRLITSYKHNDAIND